MSSLAPPADVATAGHIWRRLTLNDLGAVIELPRRGPNRLLVPEPQSQDAAWLFIRNLRAQIFGLPMVCLRREDESLFGVASTGLANPKSRVSYLLSLFDQPEHALAPLQAYIRHVFWNFPLTRLYWHCPVLDELDPYRGLYRAAGFVEEGFLPAHATGPEGRVDVAVYGLLRRDFETGR